MTKLEVYNLVLDFHRKQGIGLPGLVVLGNKGDDIKKHLESLLEEGHILKYDLGSGSSFVGAPEALVFYITTKAYNVWEDTTTTKGGLCNPTNCLRLYLGLHEHTEKGLDSSEKILKPGLFDCLRDVEFIAGYSKWLEKNEKELRKLLSLEPVSFLKESEIVLTQEEVDFLFSMGWYKKNISVFEALQKSQEALGDEKKLIEVLQKLQRLYDSQSGNSYADEAKENVEKIEYNSKKIAIRTKLHNIMEICTKEENVQSFFDEIISKSTKSSETKV